MSAFLSDTILAGRVGTQSRGQGQSWIVECGFLNPAKAPSFFGQPVKYSAVSRKFEKLEAGDTIANFYGILLEKGSQEPVAPNDFVTPNTRGNHDILRGSSYLFIKCSVGTPVRGGAVYINPTANQFEATSSGSNFVVPGITWSVDGKDANSVSEVFFK